MTRIIHAITPGDHFSPRTGSAIPTVVHGLASASGQDPAWEHAVLLDRSTYAPRYPSARVIEYTGASGPSAVERVADPLLARWGRPRRATERYWRPLAAALAHEEPAVVIAHNAPVLPSLVRESPHRVVLYAHNELFRTIGHAEARRLLDPVAAIVCVSEHLAVSTRSRLPATLHDRIHVVGNGVDTAQFPARSRDRADGPLRIVFLGRVVEEKGPDVLLEAAASLGRTDLEILVVGSYGFDPAAPLSPYESGLRALAARTGLAVTFQPFSPRAALPGLLADADVMVVPSRWPEPSGLTVGEGMSTGLVVVASRAGGIPEVLGDAGILVPPGDAIALAAALDRVASDPALRRDLGIRARTRAEQHDWAWSWSALKRVLVAT
jgi:glycosyltransferase involved in cell wall biosynthesis